MARWTTLAVASLATLTLAAPDSAWGQASRRGGSDSSSAPSSGGSSPRSGGQDSGGARSPQGEGRVVGTARPRSGTSAGGGGDQSSASQGGSSTRSNPGTGVSSGARARGERASQGEAQARQYWRPGGASRPTYLVGSYYPWYGSSFGFYDPWSYGYGYSRWSRYPYGAGYGVFGYPYGFYDPYSYGYDSYSGGGYSRRETRSESNDRPMGAIRLRANPRHARVYIDGALVGTVDEFDGLSDHLELEAGSHQLELRADGFETYTTDVSVRAGRTMTERANLRKTN